MSVPLESISLIEGLSRDQEKIYAWLEEEVNDFDPPNSDVLEKIPGDLGLRVAKPQAHVPSHLRKPNDSVQSRKIPRIDLYQKLLDIYDAEKLRWTQLKRDARPKDFSNESEVDAYNRLLAIHAPVVDAKLEALWTVLLVRGQYYRVRRYLENIDIEGASERLQKAKESLGPGNLDDT